MTLKLRKRSLFPALVQVQSPIILDKAGSTYTFSLDESALQSAFGNIFLTPTVASSVSNKTLDNTNTITVKDANFTLQDDGDATKQVQFQLSGLTTATTRTWTLQDATDTLVGRATTDTLTNKTIDTAGPNTIKINGNTLSATAGTATITFPNSTDTIVGRATADTFTGIKTFNNAKLSLAGSSSGSTLLNAAATASGTLTLPAATDTLVGKATTDILTNKTIDTAGPNTLKVGGVTLSAGQFPGTATNDSATAGNIGEYVSASATAVSLTTATPANVTSISLTAGDWDVWGQVMYNPAASTSFTNLAQSIGTTSASLGASNTLSYSQNVFPSGQVIGNTNWSAPPVRTRFSLSSTTTIFLVAQAAFTVSTMAVGGSIQARRIR